MTETPIEVVAAVVQDGGCVLLCQRHDGDHLPLHWEFPGGKIEAGEEPSAALVREIGEELGTGANVGARVGEVLHAYSDKTVRLHFFRVRLDGAPRLIVHRELRWVPLRELASYMVPPPNAVIVRQLIAGELDSH